MKALLHSSKETFLGKKISKRNLLKTCFIALLKVLHHCNVLLKFHITPTLSMAVKQQDSQCHSGCVLMWSSVALRVAEAAQLIHVRQSTLFVSVVS